MQNKIKNKIKIISVIFISFLMIFCNCNQPQAAYMDREIEGNKKEHQILKKISIIKGIFPNQIDREALYATIAHRASMTSYVADAYDPYFNEDNYRNQIMQIKKSQETIQNTDNKKYSQSGDSADLLLAATIIMLDSSGWIGSYSDENYKKALASNKLVGNMADENDILANGFNAIFCGAGAAVDTLATPIQFGADLIQGQTDTFVQRKSSRYYTMNRICENGYIGGIYSHVQNMSNPDQKQLAKDKTAEEIIKLAESFRNGDNCIMPGEGIGDATNWRQYSDPWAPKTLGSGGQTISAAGCTSTSMAYLIHKSGTTINGSSFNPGVFVENASYTSSNLVWNSWKGIAPNFIMNKQNQNISNHSASSVASIIDNELKTPSGNNNQTFVIIEMTGHWVAVDHVENGVVYVMDPAADQGVGLVTLETALNRGGKSRSLIHYNTFYASDVSFGGTGPSSLSGKNGGTNYCNAGGDLDGFLRYIAEVEGIQDSCTVNGKEGYKSYTDSMDQGYAGKTTSYGITQVYNRDLAASVGYTSFDRDMSNGCVEKEYIDAMAKKTLQERTDAVREYFESKSGGRKLAEYQYHALASINHHWPVGSRRLMDELVNISDLKSYAVYDLFLKYNGLHGAQGALNRREADYHLFYNGNYDLKRVFDVKRTEAYWRQRVEVYKSEQVG